MSITLLDSAADIEAVERPIFWEVTTDRTDELTYSTIYSVIDSGGNCSYNIGIHKLDTGDVVLMAGITEDTDYNGRQNILSVTGGRIITDKTFTVNAVSGTVVRDIDNFQIKAELYKGTGEHSEISTIATDGGFAKLTVAAAHNILTGDSVTISGTNKSYAIVSVATDGGLTEYEIPSHSMVVGQEVTVAGIVVDTAYNGKQRVVQINDATHVTTQGTYSAPSGVVGTLDYLVYDGVHTVTAVASLDITIDATFDIDVTGQVTEATLIGSKRQKEITVASVDLFRFNVANFIKSTLTFDAIALDTVSFEVVSPTLGSITNYSVRFVEQFDNALGLLTDFREYQSAVTKKAVNASIQHTETQSMAAYTVESTAKLFLTNMPTTEQLYHANDLIQLSFLTSDPTQKIELSEYDAAFGYFNSTSVLKTIDMDRGIAVIDTSLFQSDTIGFTFTLKDAGGAVNSVLMGFTLDARCYDRPLRVTWLNRRGGFDSFWFTGDKTETIRTKKILYEKGLSKDFAISDRGRSTIGSKSMRQDEIWSDFLTVEQSEWLEEIYTSKHVYIEEDIDGQREYVPIVVLDKKQRLNTNGRIGQIRLKYELPELRING